MWNLDRRRWEKGASASEMEAFIFLFCWSANVLRGKGKNLERKADLEEEKSFYTGPQSEAYFTLWSGTTGSPRLLFIAFISEDMEDWSQVSVASHFCPCSFFFGEVSIYFRRSCTDAVFFLYHLWKTHMSDHGQGLPLLVSSSIVAMSVCQWRERLLKETIVRVRVVNGDGAIAGIRWTTGSFHQAPALSRSSPTGWTL